MLQNTRFQITIKKGATNENLERNVYHEPVCNYTIVWVIKASQGTWTDGLSFFNQPNEHTAIKLLCIENQM